MPPPPSTERLLRETQESLQEIVILPRRLRIETLAPETVEVPRIRGAWGAALHDLDPIAYQTIFKPAGSSTLPSYIVRPVMPWTTDSIQLDMILIGAGIQYDESSLRAWDIASGRGLDSERTPFLVRDRRIVLPDAQLGDLQTAWPLSAARWQPVGDSETTPCSIRFQTPLCLMRQKERASKGKKILIAEPTLTDIVAKGCRRVSEFLPASAKDRWNDIKAELIALSKTTTTLPWQATDEDEPGVFVKRYSATQKKDFNVEAVHGHIELPEGPGPLWPLLAALTWLHLGKGNVVGLGWPCVDQSNS